MLKKKFQVVDWYYLAKKNYGCEVHCPSIFLKSGLTLWSIKVYYLLLRREIYETFLEKAMEPTKYHSTI